MEKSSSSSSGDVSQAAAAAAAAAAGGRRATPSASNPCLILEAVKGILLKCLGLDHIFKNQGNDQKQKEKEEASGSNPHESCSTATDPPTSATTATDPGADPPTGDAAATTVSLAVPQRPGPSTGSGPRIN